MNSKKYYVGIDPSFSGSGIVIIDDEYNIIHQKLIETKKKNDIYDIEKRMLYIINELQFILEFKENIELTLIEGISFGSRGEASEQLAALNYFIRIFLFQNNIKYNSIPPTTLKKFVTGKGFSKKNLMLKEVYKKWGVDFDDDNLCDAYGLARFAEQKCV